MRKSIRLYEEAEATEKKGDLKNAANLYRQAASEAGHHAAFRIAVGKAEELEAKVYPQIKLS